MIWSQGPNDSRKVVACLHKARHMLGHTSPSSQLRTSVWLVIDFEPHRFMLNVTRAAPLASLAVSGNFLEGLGQMRFAYTCTSTASTARLGDRQVYLHWVRWDGTLPSSLASTKGILTVSSSSRNILTSFNLFLTCARRRGRRAG